MLHDELAHGFEIVAPDRVDEIAALDQARPARRSITPRERKLRFGEFYFRWICFCARDETCLNSASASASPRRILAQEDLLLDV